MGVPLLSLAVSPVQAAALLLPILIAMDLVSLWIWRQHGDTKTLTILLPGALVGIAIGWATSAYVPRDALRLVIGVITILFVLRYVYNVWRVRRGIIIPAKPHRPAAGELSRLASRAMAASSPMPAARPSRSTPCR